MMRLRHMAAVLALCAAAPAQAASIVTEWLDETIPAANQVAWEPTVGARFLAIAHTAIYDAWAAYDPQAVGVFTGATLRGQGGQATVANKREAISHAAYGVLSVLSPPRRKALGLRMKELGYDPSADSPAARVGRRAAAAALAACRHDGANQSGNYADTTGYAPQEASSAKAWAWRAIPFLGASQIPVTPHWGRVMPFGLERADQFRPPPPPEPTSAEWDRQVEEIIEVGANLNDERKAIAEYWIPWGSPPAAHLLELTKWVSLRDDYRLDDDVKLFFIVANAMNDTGIATWEAKYHYDYLRPVSGVRALGERRIKAWLPLATPPALAYSVPASKEAASAFDKARASAQRVGEIAAKDWTSYLPTPPFPAYVSGHATFTAAWARALELITAKPDFGFKASVRYLHVEQRHLDKPVELVYPTFWSAAQASGLSRIYGGIHWQVDNLEGLTLGRDVADQAWRRAQQFFMGSAAPAAAAFDTLRPPLWRSEAGAGGATFSAERGLRTVLAPGGSGLWRTSALDPLPMGEYEARLRVDAGDDGAARLAVSIRSVSDEANALAEAEKTIEPGRKGETLSLTWRSDGRTPFRMEIAAASQNGGEIVVGSVENIRMWTIEKGSARFRPMNSLKLSEE